MDPNALLIGFRDKLKLNIYLDYKNNDDVYLQFGMEYKFTRDEFISFLNFMRVANQPITPEKVAKSKPGILSPKSLAEVGYIMLLENGNLKVEYKHFVKILQPQVYFEFIEELKMAEQALERCDKIRAMSPEARAALGIDEVGRPLSVKSTMFYIRLFGYGFALLMMLIDVILLIAAIFNPILLYLVAIIALSIVLAYLLLPQSEKKGISMFIFNMREFMEKDFWIIAQGLPISRKTVELFLVLLIVMTIMTAYFSKSIPAILNWGKSLYKDMPSTSVNNDDVLKSISVSSNRSECYNINKKCIGFANFYRNFFDALMLSKVILKKYNTVTFVSGDNSGLEHLIEGEILTYGSVVNAQDFVSRFRKHSAITDLKTMQIPNGITFSGKAFFNFSSQTYFKQMRLLKRDKKQVQDVTEKYIYTIVGKTSVSMCNASYHPRNDKIVTTFTYLVQFNNFEQIVKFLSGLEAEPHCLQVFIEELTRTDSGNYNTKFKVIYAVLR